MKRLILGACLAGATTLGVVVAPAYAAEPVPHRIIFATDVCDPASFNAAVGPGTCVRPGGGVPFALFLDQLSRLHRVPAWQFAPGVVSATTTDPIQVRNIGGEVHTFTEVAKFGGGVVPLLNQLGGTPVMAPECGASPNEDNHILNPGDDFTFTEDGVGTHLYQCCIHPWMHETLTIRPSRPLLITPR
jgi:plastocyanin